MSLEQRIRDYGLGPMTDLPSLYVKGKDLSSEQKLFIGMQANNGIFSQLELKQIYGLGISTIQKYAKCARENKTIQEKGGNRKGNKRGSIVSEDEDGTDMSEDTATQLFIVTMAMVSLINRCII